MKSIYFRCEMIFVYCVLIFGCSVNKQPLDGRVTYPDGSPLEAGVVCFEENGFLARGKIKEDGRYTVGSESSANGIPLGIYKVYINSAEKLPEGRLGPLEPLIDKKYANIATSGLTFTADGKTRKFDITVERFVGK